MISRVCSVVFLSILACFWAQVATAAACERAYSIAYSNNYIPYQYVPKNLIPTGLDIDVVKSVMAEMGCEYNLLLMPSKRGQMLLKRGALDIMPAASITVERSEYAHFSAPYRDETVTMFVRASDYDQYKGYKFKDAVDQRLSITAGLGGWYGPEYGKEKQRALDTGALSLNAQTEARIQQLLHNRVDMVIADLYVGYHHVIKARQLDAIRPLPHFLNTDPVHFMLSKKSVSPDFVLTFNQALAVVLKSREYKELLGKYRPIKSTPSN
ncbi:ABC transporter substrate-binding protein [Kiloniella sp. EL199]|uniref:substrate-binding periplasmic protein n=1 Tax=Kiloniella sp. EL199 TaxID=2107581 RepID=UPI000EA1D1A1|nr:transporter substrate-binding domain-containing protein [Kiloniella sp. EL199]